MRYIVALLISLGICILLIFILAVGVALINASNEIEQMLDDEDQAKYLRAWEKRHVRHSARRKKG